MKTNRFIILAAALVSLFAGRAQNDSTQEKIRTFQFTFVTPVGTNGLESYKITNRLSFNLLFGISRGLQGFEAGVVNVILKDVKGVQCAAFSNVVLGHVNGAQFSSYFNYGGGDLRGAAFAGMANIHMGELHGGQFASAFNLNRKGGHGIQIAAASNVMLGDFKGSQISAAANIINGNIEGAQISAGVNVAKKVKGVQIGILNIADSVDGATIGFLNFVRHGKHQLELSGDEFFYTNLSYRTGTDAFYNIFTLGFSPGSKDQLWQFGYGAGTSFKLKDKLWGDVSATIQHVNSSGFYWGTSELMKLYCGVEYRFAKKFSVAAGPTLNLYLSDVLLTKNDPSMNIAVPYHGLDHTTADDFNLKGWVGGKIALRFL